jgi:hypothetical protein
VGRFLKNKNEVMWEGLKNEVMVECFCGTEMKGWEEGFLREGLKKWEVGFLKTEMKRWEVGCFRKGIKLYILR